MKTTIKILIAIVVILIILFVDYKLPVAIAEAPIQPIPEWKLVKDPLFEKIGYCESKHDLTAKNPNSSASGEYQWLKGSWKYYGEKLWGKDWINKDIFSEDNRELAWYVYTHFGTADWEADQKSYDCWKGEIPNATHKRIYGVK